MVAIKNRSSKAYILLESLVALVIFSIITSLFLSALATSRKSEEREFRRQEMLALATMAVQTNQRELCLNGEHVFIERDSKHISIISQGKELLRVEKE